MALHLYWQQQQQQCSRSSTSSSCAVAATTIRTQAFTVRNFNQSYAPLRFPFPPGVAWIAAWCLLRMDVCDRTSTLVSSKLSSFYYIIALPLQGTWSQEVSACTAGDKRKTGCAVTHML
jgi:hypothetical protein